MLRLQQQQQETATTVHETALGLAWGLQTALSHVDTWPGTTRVVPARAYIAIALVASLILVQRSNKDCDDDDDSMEDDTRKIIISAQDLLFSLVQSPPEAEESTDSDVDWSTSLKVSEEEIEWTQLELSCWPLEAPLSKTATTATTASEKNKSPSSQRQPPQRSSLRRQDAAAAASSSSALFSDLLNLSVDGKNDDGEFPDVSAQSREWKPGKWGGAAIVWSGFLLKQLLLTYDVSTLGTVGLLCKESGLKPKNGAWQQHVSMQLIVGTNNGNSSKQDSRDVVTHVLHYISLRHARMLEKGTTPATPDPENRDKILVMACEGMCSLFSGTSTPDRTLTSLAVAYLWPHATTTALRSFCASGLLMNVIRNNRINNDGLGSGGGGGSDAESVFALPPPIWPPRSSTRRSGGKRKKQAQQQSSGTATTTSTVSVTYANVFPNGLTGKADEGVKIILRNLGDSWGAACDRLMSDLIQWLTACYCDGEESEPGVANADSAKEKKRRPPVQTSRSRKRRKGETTMAAVEGAEESTQVNKESTSSVAGIDSEVCSLARTICDVLRFSWTLPPLEQQQQFASVQALRKSQYLRSVVALTSPMRKLLLSHHQGMATEKPILASHEQDLW